MMHGRDIKLPGAIEIPPTTVCITQSAPAGNANQQALPISVQVFPACVTQAGDNSSDGIVSDQPRRNPSSIILQAICIHAILS